MWCWDADLCLLVCFQRMWFSRCLALWDAVTVEARGSIWTGHPPPTVCVRDHVCLKVCVCVCLCVCTTVGILKFFPGEWQPYQRPERLPAKPVAHTHTHTHTDKYIFIHNSKAYQSVLIALYCPGRVDVIFMFYSALSLNTSACRQLGSWLMPLLAWS